MKEDQGHDGMKGKRIEKIKEYDLKEIKGKKGKQWNDGM
jgi:hypothetical protein